MARDRPLALALVTIGAIAALFVEASWPARRPPLYDGVVVPDPYEWLDPPPGYPGGAEGTSDTVDVVAGENRIVAVYTDEQPPQAQVLAQRGALRLASGATSLTVTITPTEVAARPGDGYIDGNVYEIDIVDQLGRPVSPRSGAEVSVVLRPANDALLDATIEEFDGTTWRDLRTAGGGPFAFEAVVPRFGDFALVGSGVSPYPTVAASVLPSSVPAETVAATAAPASQPAATPASTPVPATAGSGSEVPIGPIAAIAAGLLGLLAVLLLYGRRPRRRDEDRWR